MKICIVQELNQYAIYKVADHLLESFHKEKGESVVVEGRSLSDVVAKFEAIDKLSSIEFDSELIKYKVILTEQEENTVRHKQRMRI